MKTTYNVIKTPGTGNGPEVTIASFDDADDTRAQAVVDEEQAKPENSGSIFFVQTVKDNYPDEANLVNTLHG